MPRISQLDLSGLNAAQRRAVTAPAGSHLVVAGAGTGKTKTLTYRVAHLLDQGVDPERIVLLTFTRKAAVEITERVRGLIGRSAQRVQSGTFHSYAVGLLRRYAHCIGDVPEPLTQQFVILDQSDAESLVGIVRGEMGYGKEVALPKAAQLLRIISYHANLGESIGSIVAEYYPKYVDQAAVIEAVADGYRRRKEARGWMDFDDILLYTVQYMEDYDKFRQAIANTCEHLLVDEYQDTNFLQERMASLLTCIHGNLMAVGDEAQSIYHFRGATVRNILQFGSTFPGAGVMLLEDNYRSTQEVLNVANAILAGAAAGYGKVLRGHKPPGPLPTLVNARDEESEARYVANAVLALRNKGVPLRHVAVLFRTGRHSYKLEVALNKLHIPVRKFGGLRFGEAAHIKDVVALLRIVYSGRDELAWWRVLAWLPGIGEITAQKITKNIVSSSDLRLNTAPYAKSKRAYVPELERLASLVDRLRREVDPADTSTLVEQVVEYYTPYMEVLYTEDYDKRVMDLDTLKELAETATGLGALLSDLALDPPIAAGSAGSKDWVTLSTIHSAKGLEWESVFILRLGEGSFPSGQAHSKEEQEEERRLLYVAVTRAKTELTMVQASNCSLLTNVAGLVKPVEATTLFRAGMQGGFRPKYGRG